MRRSALAVVAVVAITACAPAASGPPATSTTTTTTTAPATPLPTSDEPAPRPEPAPPSSPRVRVERVVDGDTVVLADGRRVRLLGIDAPETDPEECYAEEATRVVRDLVAGRDVEVRPDPTQDATDRYGRTLASLVLPDGADVSVLAAEAGAARSYVYDVPVSAHPEITAAEGRARAAGRGVWACAGPAAAPPGPAAAPPGQAAAPPGQAAPPAAEPAAGPVDAASPGAGPCAPGYDPCIPPGPPDLDCADLDGPVTVTGADPHRLDGDGDGLGCA